MTTMLVYTGRVLPHEMALRLVHLAYRARGVLAKNLYSRVNTTKPTTWVRTLVAMVRPWTIKYEMYRLDALGRLLARISGTLVGLSTICLATAVADEEMVATRKTWMTWKAK